jgi:hypothetical protein
VAGVEEAKEDVSTNIWMSIYSRSS